MSSSVVDGGAVVSSSSSSCGVSKTKRRRIVTDSSECQPDVEQPMLPGLLLQNRWEEAAVRTVSHPQEARDAANPSPLALACRLGAPVECVRAILNACPAKLRHVLDARGTPIHEAIVCDHVGASVIEVLLRADESLEGGGQDIGPTRACLLQDVDGFTPLHLLIRRRFQAHILNDESANLMQILEMLVASCPEAVLIPDQSEYEEPPIIYALKANIYAPALVSDDDTIARVERQIYEILSCMLRHCPQAASQVFTGYRGQYTALHSAVFHGRNTSTVELLLQTEASIRTDGETNCVLANTQGELPLHFCAMRGERPRSVALIANAAPQAVISRDSSGLTPLHWLWARFVSSLLALDRLGAGDDTTVDPLRIIRDPNASVYSSFASLEQGDFELDLQLIKRMDPPVDFLRMRHIPIDVLGQRDSIQWADQAYETLSGLRGRCENNAEGEARVWSRRECVISLFWTKVVSLIKASAVAINDTPQGDSVLVHSAFAAPSCLSAVCRIVARLFGQELLFADERGRLPIHYAAARPFHEWDWSRGSSHGESSAASQLLKEETLEALETALDLSPQQALTVKDSQGQLPLHVLIDNLAQASARFPIQQDNTVQTILSLLDAVVRKSQVSLQCRDGRSMLYPFLQAAASGTEHDASSDLLTFNMTFQLLREDPATLISRAH